MLCNARAKGDSMATLAKRFLGIRTVKRQGKSYTNIYKKNYKRNSHNEAYHKSKVRGIFLNWLKLVRFSSAFIQYRSQIDIFSSQIRNKQMLVK